MEIFAFNRTLAISKRTDSKIVHKHWFNTNSTAGLTCFVCWHIGLNYNVTIQSPHVLALRRLNGVPKINLQPKPMGKAETCKLLLTWPLIMWLSNYFCMLWVGIENILASAFVIVMGMGLPSNRCDFFHHLENQKFASNFLWMAEHLLQIYRYIQVVFASPI